MWRRLPRIAHQHAAAAADVDAMGRPAVSRTTPPACPALTPPPCLPPPLPPSPPRRRRRLDPVGGGHRCHRRVQRHSLQQGGPQAAGAAVGCRLMLPGLMFLAYHPAQAPCVMPCMAAFTCLPTCPPSTVCPFRPRRCCSTTTLENWPARQTRQQVRSACAATFPSVCWLLAAECGSGGRQGPLLGQPRQGSAVGRDLWCMRLPRRRRILGPPVITPRPAASPCSQRARQRRGGGSGGGRRGAPSSAGPPQAHPLHPGECRALGAAVALSMMSLL